MSAREEILGRVRAVCAAAPSAPPVPRDYGARTADGADVFAARLEELGVRVARVAEAELDGAVRGALAASGARRLVVPAGIPAAWTREVEALVDQPPLDFATLDAADGVVTTCRLAIAQTGTIVLDGSAGMGRRALSLLPDYHLCVVRAGQLVGSVPEAIGALDPARPLTFTTGPSATVDIEMVRVAGVHGPRRLEVLLVIGN